MVTKVEPIPASFPVEHKRAANFDLPVSSGALERSARLFRALGDAARLRLVSRLALGAFYVTELADLEKESITVISQWLRVLRADDVVSRRRHGKHTVYFLADQHVLDLVFNGLAHASEQHVHSSQPASIDPF